MIEMQIPLFWGRLGFANNMPPKKPFLLPVQAFLKCLSGSCERFRPQAVKTMPIFSLFLFDSMEGEKQK